MNSYEQLLQNNKEWAREVIERDADFFNRSAQSQSPEFLWIGCSDSRVPANQITGTKPGEIFVHRNIEQKLIKQRFTSNFVEARFIF